MGFNNNGGDYAEAPLGQNDVVHGGEKRRECNDVFFLLAFLGVFIMTIVFAGQYGSDFVDASALQTASNSTGFKTVIKYVSYCGLSAVGMSLVWVVILIVAGEFMIWLALCFIIALNIFMAVYFTKKLHDENDKYYYWPAIVFGVLALLTALYACCIRNRIKFAAKHLKVAGSAILSLPMTILVGFVMVFFQLGWVVTWILGNIGILYKSDHIRVPTCDATITLNGTQAECKIETDVGAVFGITVGMLVVFFWGAFVIQNIVAVTVSGTVASWKLNTSAPCVTMSSWLRSVTLSLGSICFGSLIVAILETIKQVINALASAARQSGNCVAACILCCVGCCISCIESLVELFNRFAYAYVGIYGYSFISASKHVFQLFRSKGWSAIVNDDLTGNVFFMGNCLIGFLSAYIGVSLVDGASEGTFDNIKKPEIVIGFCGFLIGYAVSQIFMSVLSAAVTTVFVLWAEDPQGWQLTRPDHYASLHNAWLEIYPEEYNNGQGKPDSSA